MTPSLHPVQPKQHSPGAPHKRGRDEEAVMKRHYTREAVMKRQTDRGLDLIIPHHAKAASPACALAILEGDTPPGAQQPTRRHPHCIGITSCTEHWVKYKLQ